MYKSVCDRNVRDHIITSSWAEDTYKVTLHNFVTDNICTLSNKPILKYDVPYDNIWNICSPGQ